MNGGVSASLTARPRGLLRTGIGASLAEGAAVGVVFNALEQWLVPLLQIRLGATASTVFLLTLVPLAVNVALGPWSGALIARFGGHRAVSIGIGLFQAGCLGLLAVAAWMPEPTWMPVMALVLAIAIPASMALSQPAWFAWTGTFVPTPLHGRYFGRRNRLLMTMKLATAVAAALLIRLWPMQDDPRGLATIFLVAMAARLIAVRMLTRQPELPPRPGATAPASVGGDGAAGFRSFLAGLRGSHFGRWTVVWAALFFGYMIAGPAFSPYMLAPVEQGGLGLSERPLLFTALVVSCQIMRLVAYPAFGWIIDRIGPTLVLRWAVLCIAIIPASWAFIEHVPTLIAIEVVNGLCWCAAECAAMVITLGCHTDPNERVRLIGYHQTLLGLVQVAAVGLGMGLLPLLPSLDGSPFRSLFLVSVILRIPAVILAWTLLPRLPVDVRRQLRGLWRELPGVGLVATASRGVSMLMRRIVHVDPPIGRTPDGQ